MKEENYELVFLPLFEMDLSEAVRYIANVLNSPTAAKKLVEETELAILERQKQPDGYQPYPSIKTRKYPYYTIRVRNYLVFYVLYDKTMEVRRFLHSKRSLNILLP